MKRNISVSENPQNVDRDVRATVEQIAVAARYTEKIFGACPTASQISLHGSSFRRAVVHESLWNNLARVVDLGYAEEFQDEEGAFRYKLTDKGEGLVYGRIVSNDGAGLTWIRMKNYHNLRYGSR